jgi:hypothetical protein
MKRFRRLHGSGEGDQIEEAIEVNEGRDDNTLLLLLLFSGSQSSVTYETTSLRVSTLSDILEHENVRKALLPQQTYFSTYIYISRGDPLL